jgi:hypothetical protein
VIQGWNARTHAPRARYEVVVGGCVAWKGGGVHFAFGGRDAQAIVAGKPALDPAHLAPVYAAHAAWWAAFWQRRLVHRLYPKCMPLLLTRVRVRVRVRRSYVSISASAPSGATITSQYALTRYLQCLQSRGTVWPEKFNGQLFVASMPPVAPNAGPDFRQWGACARHRRPPLHHRPACFVHACVRAQAAPSGGRTRGCPTAPCWCVSGTARRLLPCPCASPLPPRVRVRQSSGDVDSFEVLLEFYLQMLPFARNRTQSQCAAVGWWGGWVGGAAHDAAPLRTNGCVRACAAYFGYDGIYFTETTTLFGRSVVAATLHLRRCEGRRLFAVDHCMPLDTPRRRHGCTLHGGVARQRRVLSLLGVSRDLHPPTRRDTRELRPACADVGPLRLARSH